MNRFNIDYFDDIKQNKGGISTPTLTLIPSGNMVLDQSETVILLLHSETICNALG